MSILREELVARPLSEWHEDMGPKLWWHFPVREAPYVGSPLCDDWPGYHTHYTKIIVPLVQSDKHGERVVEATAKK